MVEIKNNRVYLDSEDLRISNGLLGAFRSNLDYCVDLYGVGESYGEIVFAQSGREYRKTALELILANKYEVVADRSISKSALEN